MKLFVTSLIFFTSALCWGHTVVDSILAPASNIVGLGNDNGFLFASSSETKRLYKIDISTGQSVLDWSINVPLDKELCGVFSSFGTVYAGANVANTVDSEEGIMYKYSYNGTPDINPIVDITC